MTTRISKIENFKYQNIVTIKQKTAERRFLVLDLWEDTKDVDINKKYQQIFLQMNNVKILETPDNKICFDLTCRKDIMEPMYNIENNVIAILKNYFMKINKKGTFKFCSIIKKIDNTDQGMMMAYSLKNSDYPINMYDSNKRLINDITLTNSNSTFNIIIELMNIIFDMKEGTIVIDTRLRLMMENKIQPSRIKLTDIQNFIQEQCSDNDNDNDVMDIKKSFDMTKSEKNITDAKPIDKDNNVNKAAPQLKEKKNIEKQTKNEVKNKNDADKNKPHNTMNLHKLEPISEQCSVNAKKQSEQCSVNSKKQSEQCSVNSKKQSENAKKTPEQCPVNAKKLPTESTMQNVAKNNSEKSQSDIHKIEKKSDDTKKQDNVEKLLNNANDNDDRDCDSDSNSETSEDDSDVMENLENIEKQQNKINSLVDEIKHPENEMDDDNDDDELDDDFDDIIRLSPDDDDE